MWCMPQPIRFRILCCAWLALGSTALTHAQPEPPSAGAGYRKSRLALPTAEGKTRESPFFLWHPTSDPPRRFEYFLQVGFVAPDGAVAPGKHPLIIFSHGYLGTGEQTIFLMEALARAGYIVASVNHADSLAQRRAGQRLSAPKFADARSWDDKKFRDRREDMTALLDHLLAQNRDPSSFLHDHIREDAIGIMGHSLGGYTALGMIGAWPAWRDERLRAALLLAPYSQPFLGRLDPGQIKIPAMLQGGTLDFGITPLLPPIYDKLAAPKYFLVLQQQTHFAWTNILTLGKTTTECLEQPGPVKLIADYSIAFFDKTLRGTDAPLLRKPNDALQSFRFQEP